MWIILFIIFSSTGTYLVFLSISNYLNYEIVTKIQVSHEQSVKLPAITLFILQNKKENISLKKVLDRCEFNNLPCSDDDFDKDEDVYGFRSFKFKEKKSVLAGAANGLKVNINTANLSQIKSIYKGIGIVIHNNSFDPGYYFGISNENVNIIPGFFTDIQIRRKFNHKLGHPYSNCLEDVSLIDSYDSDLYRFILNNTKYAYRQNDCFNYCLGREYYKFNNITNKIDHVFNAIQDLNDLKSEEFYKMIDAIINNICLSSCPLECDSVTYELSLSSMKFSDGNENITGFNAYYADSTYTTITELAKQEFLDLISNIGGNLGLFIGISFLSFAEIFELLFEIVFILFQKKSSNTVETL
jgi:hypothetical protein